MMIQVGWLTFAADTGDGLDDLYVREALWKGDGWSSFTADDCFAIVIAPKGPSKTVRGSGPIGPAL